MNMKTFSFKYYAIFMIFCGSPWLADAAEPRLSNSRQNAARVSETVVPVKGEELPAPAPATTDSDSPSDDTHPESGSVRTWTLLELEAVADEIHPALQRDRARIESARGDALQAGLLPNPRFDSNNPQVFNGQNSLFNAGVMQEFVVKGKKRLDRAAATKVVQQTEFAYVQDRFALRAAIRQQFYVVLAA